MDTVALITGAGREVGRTMALGLLERGHGVAAVDRDAGPLRELVSLANGKSGQLFTIQANLLLPDIVAGVVEQAERRFGRVDILVNNAATGPGRRPGSGRALRFWEISDEDWHRAVLLSATVPFLLARRLAPSMIGRGFGRIVTIATARDAAADGGLPHGPAEAAADAETGAFARDLTGSGVTANVLDLGDGLAPLRPEAIVKPLLWLLSSGAGAFTGRRLVAAKWDAALPDADAAQAASVALTGQADPRG